MVEENDNPILWLVKRLILIFVFFAWTIYPIALDDTVHIAKVRSGKELFQDSFLYYFESHFQAFKVFHIITVFFAGLLAIGVIGIRTRQKFRNILGFLAIGLILIDIGIIIYFHYSAKLFLH